MIARRLTAALALSSVTPAVPAEQPPTVSAVELRDQHGRPHTVAEARGEVVVVMVVTASRLRNLRGWQIALQERFDQARYMLIADVPAQPQVTWDRVAEKLVRRVPDEVPVLIDIERRWATELELDTELPNLLVFDRQGRLAERFRGRRDAALLAEVSRALERLTGR